MPTSGIDLLLQRWERSTSLSEADRTAVRQLPFVTRSFRRDAYLVREGEPTHHCLLLLKGLAFRQKILTDGSRQIISFHIPGEFVDLQHTLLSFADHNVQSLRNVEAGQVPKDALIALMRERPQVARAVWLDTLIDSSIFREWVVNVGRRDARSRIAHLLCELALRLRAADQSDAQTCDFPMTQEQLADATGLTSVHTNRTLQELRRSGLITLSEQKLTVLDWEGLADVGDFNERYLHHSV
ncbi:Crp/Fnr family transcriptional regulator [Tsuneonella sp. HG249]